MQCSLLVVFLRVYLYLSTESNLSYRLLLENLLNTNLVYWEIKKTFRNTFQFHPDIQVGFRIHLLSFLSFSKQCAYRVFSFHYSRLIHSGNPLIRLITHTVIPFIVYLSIQPAYPLSRFFHTDDPLTQSTCSFRKPIRTINFLIQSTHSYHRRFHTDDSFL